jgi:UDP-glucose 4-epimerase
MGKILRNEPLTIIGDGKQTRCFTYINDAVKATMEAGMNPAALGGVFNIGDDNEISILEFAQTLLRIVGKPDGHIRYVKKEDIYGPSYEDILRRVPDNTRMRQVLGVYPLTPFEAGLRATVEWFMKEHGAKRSLTSSAAKAECV